MGINHQISSILVHQNLQRFSRLWRMLDHDAGGLKECVPCRYYCGMRTLLYADQKCQQDHSNDYTECAKTKIIPHSPVQSKCRESRVLLPQRSFLHSIESIKNSCLWRVPKIIIFDINRSDNPALVEPNLNIRLVFIQEHGQISWGL